MALERPKFKPIKKINGLEMREYDAYQVAVCDVHNVSNLNRAANSGFRYLFNYISGENLAGQKISMTVPVQQEPTDNGWKISFVVPSRFEEKSTPVPTSSRVVIEQIAAGNFAVLRYRGLWNSKRYEMKKEKLLEKLQQLNLQAIGEVTAAVYNPPLTPPCFRHNEVMVRVKAK